MKVFPMKAFQIPTLKRIDNMIPVVGVTLWTGLPATGKSYTLLKFLNMNGVSPLVFNLDGDAALANFSCSGMTDDPSILKAVINGEAEDLTDSIIVIDTYSRVSALLFPNNTLNDQREFADKLLAAATKYNSGIIVIGHPEDYVGKSSIFKDNQSLIRDCHEHIHIDKIVSTGRKQEEILYRTFRNKGRGVGGTIEINNWMREPMMNPLTNKMC